MEILQLLLNFISESPFRDTFASIFNHLKENDFDLKRALFSLTPEKIAPLISLFSKAKEQQKNCPTSYDGQFYGLSPIKDIADKDIIYSLNKILST